MKPLKPKQKTFQGIVIKKDTHGTATIEFERRKYIPKYERYTKERTRIHAHNPEEINAQTGDIVIINECRPISKTKNFIITKIIRKEELFKDKMERRKEGSMIKEEKTEKNNKKEEKPKEETP